MKKFYNSPEMELNYVNSFDCIASSGDYTAFEGVKDQEVDISFLNNKE